MARRDLLRDSSSHAAGELDYMLKKDQPQAEKVRTVSIDEALQGSRVVEHSSSRNVTRVLFISKNAALLNPSQQTLDGYINVADLFDEVHIIVLRTGIAPRQPVLRPNTNVWIYTVAAKYWWKLPGAAKEMLEAQLMFAAGFRPDLIVARDPLESGLIALRAADTYSRPAQLHVAHSSYTETEEPVGWFHRLLARYTIPRFKSVRVTNKKIWNKIQSFVTTKDFDILPRLNPYESILKSGKAIDLKNKFPQYVFSMLFIGQLDSDSTILEVIDGAKEMLTNTRVCLIIIGDGPLRSEIKSKAKALGIEKQIVLLPGSTEVVSYLKSAHILFVTDTNAFAEDIALQAAYAGIAMVLTGNEHREEIFTHMESAYMCEPHQTEFISEGLSVLMNDVTLRKHISEQAVAAVQNYFHQDPQKFQREYRASIEAALFAGEVEEVVSEKV